jgi:hypothetical protein
MLDFGRETTFQSLKSLFRQEQILRKKSLQSLKKTVNYESKRIRCTLRETRMGSLFWPEIHSLAVRDGQALAVGGKISSWNISD